MPDNTIAKFYRLILAALVAGCLIFHLAILWESRKQIAAGYGDFIIFYTGAQIVNDGKSKDLFKVETQNAYQAKFDVPQLDWPLPFNHAPYELLLFLPLAHLSYPAAHAIWSGVNLVFLIIMLQILLRYAHSRHSFFIGASFLAWFPTMEALRLGQDSIMSTLLLLAVFVSLKQQRDGLAGLFLALGLYKPQLVLPMAGALLVARRWNSLVVFSITGAALVAVSLAMVGWQGAFDLVSILRSMHDYAYIIYPANMPNIRGLSYVLFQAENLEILTGTMILVISLGLYALCLYLWKREFDVLDPAFDLKFSLTVVTTVLIGYHLYPHDLFPLTLSLILLFRYISSGAVSDRTVANLFFFLLIILFLPLVPRYLIKFSVLGLAAVPVLLLYTILSLEIFRRNRVKRG
ncbi:MAG: glycosyltransferase family 87 protein [Candidatus Binatia bacterium]